jgi:hypothetical protein
MRNFHSFLPVINNWRKGIYVIVVVHDEILRDLAMVKIPTPHSMATLVSKQPFFKPSKLKQPPKYWWLAMEPSTLPASIAAAKSFGKLSNDLPA